MFDCLKILRLSLPGDWLQDQIPLLLKGETSTTGMYPQPSLGHADIIMFNLFVPFVPAVEEICRMFVHYGTFRRMQKQEGS